MAKWTIRELRKKGLRAELARVSLTVIRESLAYGEAVNRGLEQAADLHKRRHRAAVEQRNGMRRRMKELYKDEYFTWEYRAPSNGSRPAEDL